VEAFLGSIGLCSIYITPLTYRRGVGMARTTLEDLFIHELSDIYSAEKQIAKALPRLARAATNPLLAEAFTSHLEETQGQIERIDQIVELTGFKLKRMKCVATEGLIEEGKELLEEIEKGEVLDAALIGASQKIEHYEIAAYGTLIALSKYLGLNDAAELLAATLAEEKGADENLSAIAEQGGNQAATLTPKKGK
jgi:ferritin-like metal-binding protein YciE